VAFHVVHIVFRNTLLEKKENLKVNRTFSNVNFNFSITH